MKSTRSLRSHHLPGIHLQVQSFSCSSNIFKDPLKHNVFTSLRISYCDNLENYFSHYLEHFFLGSSLTSLENFGNGKAKARRTVHSSSSSPILAQRRKYLIRCSSTNHRSIATKAERGLHPRHSQSPCFLLPKRRTLVKFQVERCIRDGSARADEYSQYHPNKGADLVLPALRLRKEAQDCKVLLTQRRCRVSKRPKGTRQTHLPYQRPMSIKARSRHLKSVAKTILGLHFSGNHLHLYLLLLVKQGSVSKTDYFRDVAVSSMG
ncbi:hypothetical protein VNO77_08585 [Canavalia gladiata]|uniref:Uncharacterized protein n=1 Tax=Canavalia gladiata TaxID=3824 RepID=A0AAN9MF85_CANGL